MILSMSVTQSRRHLPDSGLSRRMTAVGQQETVNELHFMVAGDLIVTQPKESRRIIVQNVSLLLIA